MTIDIPNLPEFGDKFTEPAFDQTTTDVSELLLQETALVNPLKAELDVAIPDLTTADSFLAGTLSQTSIQTAIDDMPAADVNLTVADRNSLLADLGTIKTSMAAYEGTTTTVLNNATGLLSHSDLMTQNLPIVGSTVNQALSLPNLTQSDIPGGLPTTFPGAPGLVGVTNFGGLGAVSAIPSLGLPALPAISGVPNASTLPGVNLPGVPVPSDVLTSLSGSILTPEFGGVGSLVTGNACSLGAAAVAGLTPTAGAVSSIANNITDTSALSGLVSSTSGTVSSFIPGLDSLATPFSDLGGGMGDIVSGEVGALNGTGCTTLAPAAAGFQCASAGASVSQASTITGMLTTQSSAKLVSSTATPALGDIVGLT